MKKKNGFTLIELLAVIVILGIISAIAVSLYSGYIDSSRNRTYKAAEKSMMSSTTSLLQQCRDKEEKGEICKLTDKQIPSVGASGIVYLKQLVENGYMKDVKDPKDTSKSCAEESYVLIKGEDSGSLNNKTEYQVCLICGDYITEGCSDVDYANVEKPTIVGKNNDGSLLANNGWLTTEKGTLEATFSEDVTEKIKYKYKWYKDGVEIPNTNKRKIEVTEEGTYKINVTNEIETRNIDSDEFKVNIDNVAPIDVDFSYVVTTKSIKVTGTGTGVSRLMYSFSKDNGSTWTSYQENNIYEFKNLATGTYPVKVKVRNMSMHETKSETKSVTLATLDTPTYSINPSATQWSITKIVTINYASGYNNQYSIDNGATWKSYTGPVTFTDNGTIIAKISDGVNYVVGSSLTISNIDTTPAVLTLPALNANYGASVGITSGATITDNETGIQSIVVKYNGTDITNANQLTYPGTYTVNFMVTNGAGLTSNGTRTVNITYSFSQAFGFTGGAQTFTAPINGIYKLEVWGASGAGSKGGYGGYATGGVKLTKGQSLYVYVGQKGLGGGECANRSAFNGGGAGCGYVIPGEYQVRGGGGATDIRTTQNSSYANRILVAGGGGASYGGSPTVYGTGGSGGGAWARAGISYYTPANGAIGGSASITNGGCWRGDCRNDSYVPGFSGGGGGGYTGGRGIVGNTGSVAYDWPSKCDGTAEGGTSYTGGVSSLTGASVGTSNGVRDGNGYALITLTKVE